MKKVIAIVLALVMLLALCACGSKTEAPTTDAPKTDAPKTAAPQTDAPTTGGPDWSSIKKVSLNCATADGETVGAAQALARAVKAISEKTNGQVEIKVYYSGTLAESSDLVSACADGVTDIAYITPSLYPGVFVANDVFNLKYFTEMPGPAGIKTVFRQLMDNVPAIQDELGSLGLHGVDIFGTQPMFYIKRDAKADQINTPDDMKGMVVQGSGTYATVLANHGIAAMSMGPADWYTSFERGTVDMETCHWALANDFGLAELANSYLMFGSNGGFAHAAQMLVVNEGTWNGFPDEVKQVITEEFRKSFDELVTIETDQANGIKQTQIDAGKVFHTIPEDQMQPWYDLALEQVDIWKATCAEKGIDADKIFDAYIGYVEEYLKNN